MSQRIHSCANNMNFDPVNCEAYAMKLQPRRKPETPTGRGPLVPRSERPASRTRGAGQPLQPTQQLVKARTTNVRRTSDMLKSEPTTSSVIHKELYTDNPALVEVTVKTHNINHPSRSNGLCRREPWSKLLKNDVSFENVSSFQNFDPLRTLHFLAKELQNKLMDSLPNDKNVQQMVVDMQLALSRIPPEVASSVALQIDIPSMNIVQKKSSNVDTKKHTPYTKDIDEYPIHFVKPPVHDKSCQTFKTNLAEAERLQKHLEESSAKIETACKQMENVCTRLKSEKEELEIMLRAERETVKFLRKQMEECENEKSEAVNAKILSLQQERDGLQVQIKKLKSQLESQHDASSQELKNLVQELRKQKTMADEQITILNHNLTLSNMEKEKYIAILAARDRQIKEIRAEMCQLQEVVNEQLVDLQNAPSSITSSITNMSTEWMAKSKDISKADSENSASSVHAEELQIRPVSGDKEKTKFFRECPSGDSRILKDRKTDDRKKTQQDKSLGKTTEHTTDLQNNIRDMFAEIKKQALMVSSNKIHINQEEIYCNDQTK